MKKALSLAIILAVAYSCGNEKKGKLSKRVRRADSGYCIIEINPVTHETKGPFFYYVDAKDSVNEDDEGNENKFVDSQFTVRWQEPALDKKGIARHDTLGNALDTIFFIRLFNKKAMIWRQHYESYEIKR